jgi:hypothetical protein
MDEISFPGTGAGLGESSRESKSVGYARISMAVASSVAVALLWWLSASPRAAGNIFGLYSGQTFILLVAASYVLGWVVYFLVNPQPSSSKAANCALTTATLLILFGLIELPSLLGLIDYRKVISASESVRFTTVKPWNNPSNRLDRELIHIYRPHQKVVGETPGDLVHWLGIHTDRRYKIDIEYDGNGFRNDRDIAQAPVVVIGDSFVEAGLVQKSELLTSGLARLLQVEVANLGQSGYGPQQELIALRRFGLSLQPKLVLWFFFEGNDLLDVPRYERTVRSWDEIMKERDSLKERSFTNNALLALAGLTTPKLRADSDEARKRSGRFMRGPEESTIYFAYAGTPLSQNDLTSLETVKGCLLQARELCESAGAELMLVYVPTKYRVYRDLCEFPDDGYGKTWQLNDLPSRFEDWSKAQAIPYIDLTAPLKESASKGELVYFSDDGHWNARGHEVVTRAIAGFLESSKALKGGKLQTPVALK